MSRVISTVVLSTLFLPTLLMSATPLGAQEHPIKISARVAGSITVQPAGRFSLLVRAEIPTGWHLYGLSEPAGGPIATTIEVGPPALVKVDGAIGATQATSAFDRNFNVVTSTYDDSAVFTVPVAVLSAVRDGKQTLATRVSYQI